MSDNNTPKLIYKAELIDNKIIITNNSRHVPTLSYLLQLLQADIIELIVQEKIKAEIKDTPLIKTSNPNQLRDFLRRKK